MRLVHVSFRQPGARVFLLTLSEQYAFGVQRDECEDKGDAVWHMCAAKARVMLSAFQDERWSSSCASLQLF